MRSSARIGMPGARSRVAAGLLLAGLLALAGCSSAPGSETESTSDSLTASEISVFVAASLDEVMTTIAADFEADTGISVRLSSAGSADLLAQLLQGAPADLFIPADERTMDRAATQDLISAPTQLIASNTLVIAVPAGNPAQIDALEDLEGPAGASSAPNSPVLVQCAPQVPCGAAARQVAAAADVSLAPVSEELSVTDVLGKVRSGEADAGLVYSTDVRLAAAEVDAVDIPEAAEFPNRYPAAVLAESAQPEAAAAFLEFLLTEDGQRPLREAGFTPAGES